jgi:hypothetical protein
VFAKEDCDEDEVNVVEAALELDVTEVIVEVIIALLFVEGLELEVPEVTQGKILNRPRATGAVFAAAEAT